MNKEFEELLEEEQQEYYETERRLLKICDYCGMVHDNCNSLESEDHEKYHSRKILAESKFGHIATYAERDFLKQKIARLGDQTLACGGDELQFYVWWSRSVEGCRFDLLHPTLQEYKALYKAHSHVMNGSYVNMKKYKQLLAISE